MKVVVEMRPGESKGQRLTTEDGELVEGVKSIEWHADGASRPRVVVEFYAEKVVFDLTDPVSPQLEEPV